MELEHELHEAVCVAEQTNAVLERYAESPGDRQNDRLVITTAQNKLDEALKRLETAKQVAKLSAEVCHVATESLQTHSSQGIHTVCG